MDCDIIKYTSDMAGEYLEELGKTDLKDFTTEEWFILLDVIIKNYELKKVELTPCPF